MNAPRTDPGSQVSVRPLVEADRDAVTGVFLAAWRGYATVLPDRLVDSLDELSAADLVRQGLDRAGGAFVAERSGAVVGFTRWEPGYLGSLYVHPGAQGSGAGAALLAASEGAIREAGAAQATLWVFTANAAAEQFYRAHGWTPDGGTRTEEWFFGEPEIRMTKGLA